MRAQAGERRVRTKLQREREREKKKGKKKGIMKKNGSI